MRRGSWIQILIVKFKVRNNNILTSICNLNLRGKLVKKKQIDVEGFLWDAVLEFVSFVWFAFWLLCLII